MAKFTKEHVDEVMLKIIDAALQGNNIFYTVLPESGGIFKMQRSIHRIYNGTGPVAKWIENTYEGQSREITVEEAKQLLEGQTK
jgi:hypothetical protein